MQSKMKEAELVIEAGNAMKVQKHQLATVEEQTWRLKDTLSELEDQGRKQDQFLQELASSMELFEEIINTGMGIEKLTTMDYKAKTIDMPDIDEIQTVDCNEGESWEQYMESVQLYARLNKLSLENDPYYDLLSKDEQESFHQAVINDYYEKSPNCDWKDYAMAAFCGTVAGIIDMFFVGMPGDSKLGDWTDKKVEEFVCNRSEKLWDKNQKLRNKIVKKGKNKGWSKKRINEELREKGFCTTFSQKYSGKDGKPDRPQTYQEWIKFLEEKFSVPYDETQFKKFSDYDGSSDVDLTSSNHHLLSLAHSPDLIGLIFSIIDQFCPEKTSFAINGKVKRFSSIKINKNAILRGEHFHSKIFSGIVNWLNHCISDAAGSSWANGRGAGLANPGYIVFSFMNFGSFSDPLDKQRKMTIAELSVRVFECSNHIVKIKDDGTEITKQSYDLRFGMAMMMPVVLNDILVRFLFTIRRHFFMKIPLEKCLPLDIDLGFIKRQPELRRMLLVSYGVLCLIDDVDAVVQSGGDIIEGTMHLNYYAQCRLAQIAIVELRAKFRQNNIAINDLMKDVNNNWKQMQREIEDWKPYMG